MDGGGMPILWVVAVIFVVSVVGFIAGRARALQSAGGDARRLHSLPIYYGSNVALWAVVPAAATLIVWLIVQPLFVNSRVAETLPGSLLDEGSSIGLIMSDVRRVAEGLDVAVAQGALSRDEAALIGSSSVNIREFLGSIGVALGSDVSPEVVAAAQLYRGFNATGSALMSLILIAISSGGAAYAYRRSNADFRARNVVERGVLGLLIGAASIAILTTIGILFALLFNTIEFFKLYPATEFFFGTNWAPSFSGRGGLSDPAWIFGKITSNCAARLAHNAFNRFIIEGHIQVPSCKLRAQCRNEYVLIGLGFQHFAFGFVKLFLRHNKFNIHYGLGEGRQT
ncbi:phosphate ABC transporter permease family protein [Planktomarina temperata]|nr:phosphate ABC transporter permease family protein [Planktomarina temperata]